MTSGIYQLTFANNQRYIGQSINVEARWEQHAKNILSGKASKQMLDASRHNKVFDAKLLLEVHPDWLDYFEAYYIQLLNPEVNTSRPSTVISGDHLEYMLDRLLHLGSLESLLNTLNTSNNKANEYRASFEAAMCELRETRGKLYNRVDLEVDIRVKSILDELRAGRDKIATLEQFKERVETLGWWGRLWKKW